MTDIQAVFAFGAIPMVIALLEWAKHVFPDLNKRWLPVLGLACSAVIQAASIYVAHVDPRDAVGWTILAALIAIGAYSGARATLGK